MIFIKYRNGVVHEGVVLSFGDRAVRIAVKDSDDAVEFRMMNGVWISEDCEVVRLEFAAQGSPVEIQGDDFLDALLTAASAPPLPVQRVM